MPTFVTPENYRLTFTPDLKNETLSGDETIHIRVLKPTAAITLNSVDLDLKEVTVSSGGGSSQKAQVSIDKEKQQATLLVDKLLQVGPATIHIVYTGVLNKQLTGFYLGKLDNGEKYAATQFEATDARRAFPSFDEPAYKATFDITIIADKGVIAISNSKVASDVDVPAGKHRVQFETTPKMSCYLVAFVIGNFEYLEGSADGVPIRVYTAPHKKQLGTFALEVAEHVLPFYESYFNIHYPYGKLDLIGLPDFGTGAMENTGCITFKEELLMLDEEHASVDTKKFVATVVAHEMAHQWFGDLVTMQWWDDLWLNEGFATWMSSKPLMRWKPDWQMEVYRVRDTVYGLAADSLENTHPIHQRAETPSEILETADAIAYFKTAAVLRMLEFYLGEDKFREGVNRYMHLHAYGNATAEDFSNALATSSDNAIGRIMSGFIKEAGVPFVSLKAKCLGSSNNVSLEQRRYFYDREKFESANDSLWQIPVCFRGPSGSPTCDLLTQKEQTFTVPGCPLWMTANAGAEGYYRSGYTAENVRALARDAEQALSPAERMMLLADVWASVRIGREKIGDYLTLAEGISSDRSPDVIAQMVDNLDFIDRALVTDSDRDAYRAWIRSLLSPLANSILWNKETRQSETEKGLAKSLLHALGNTAHDPSTQEYALRVTDQALKDPSSVDRDLALAAMPVAASVGDEKLYESIMSRLTTTSDPEKKDLYRQALTSFGDPKLLQKTLEYAINGARAQDMESLVGGVMQNPAGRTLAWNFIRAHWSAIQSPSGAFGGFTAVELVSDTSVFCDAVSRREVQEFFTEHPTPGTEHALKKSLERIGYCKDFKTQQTAELASWLQDLGNGPGMRTAGDTQNHRNNSR